MRLSLPLQVGAVTLRRNLSRCSRKILVPSSGPATLISDRVEMNKESKRTFSLPFFTLSGCIFSGPQWLSTMPHTPITHDRLFSFLGPGVVHLFRYWNLSNKHVQGQNRSMPMRSRVNIPLLESTSCCFFLSTATFLEVCIRFTATLSLSTLHMKSYNWCISISVTSCETNYYLETQINNVFRSAIHLWIHCLFKQNPAAGRKIPKSHKSFKRKQLLIAAGKQI